jgi:hypothetical protein
VSLGCLPELSVLTKVRWIRVYYTVAYLPSVVHTASGWRGALESAYCEPWSLVRCFLLITAIGAHIDTEYGHWPDIGMIVSA